MTCEIVIFSTEEQAKKEMMDICDQNECLYKRHTQCNYTILVKKANVLQR